MDTIKLYLSHRDVNFVFVVTDYTYEPGYSGRMPSMNDPGDPAYGAEIYVNAGYVMLDDSPASFQQASVEYINKQLKESDKIFDALLEDNLETILDKLENHHEQKTVAYLDDLAESLNDMWRDLE